MFKDYPLYTIDRADLPRQLASIHNPPKQLYCQGADLKTLLKHKSLTVVGSRSLTAYGEEVTQDLVRQLAEQGIVIVSGLAYGVDRIAHEACLDAEGLTIAVLPGPLDNIVPRGHQRLARRILKYGGALITEMPPGETAFKQHFVSRNRLMSGLTDATLITEARLPSGTLRTADYAFDQNRDLLVVPGNITSPASAGANNLIRQQKAHLVMCVDDVLEKLAIKPRLINKRKITSKNPAEQTILDLICQGTYDGDNLLAASGLTISKFNQALTMLEISNKVKPLGSNQWCLC